MDVDVNSHCSYEDVCITGFLGLGDILSLIFMSDLEEQVYRDIPKLPMTFSLSAFPECEILSRQTQISFPEDVCPL